MLNSFDFPAFDPHPWLRGPHAQTLATQLPRARLTKEERHYEARRFRVSDDSEILALCRWQPARRAAPVVLLLHGLTGSAKADYMLGMAEKVYDAGFSAVRMNLRGCGGSEALSPTIYHAGQYGDIGKVARELAEVDGIPRLYLGGCSLGGGMILRLLGELGDAAPPWLRGCAVISPAIELCASQDALDRDPACRLYREYFLRGLKEQYKTRARLHPGLRGVLGAYEAKTLRGFDECVTGPLSPYGSAERYYAEASALSQIGRLARPTMIVTAQDDPFIPYRSFLAPALQHNTWISLVAPSQGGHVAFIGKRPGEHRVWCDLDHHWAENRVLQFLHHLEQAGRPAYARRA